MIWIGNYKLNCFVLIYKQMRLGIKLFPNNTSEFIYEYSNQKRPGKG